MVQEELQLPKEIQALQARLDLSVNIFKQITPIGVPYDKFVQQVANVLSIYSEIDQGYRLEIEVNKDGYDAVGGNGFEFARKVLTADGSRHRYMIVVKAPVEEPSQVPNATALELSRFDSSPTGPTAFELMTIREGGFDHGLKVWPENVLAMKIVPTSIPLPKAV